MNLIEVPDKVTVRLDVPDKVRLQTILRDGKLPGYRPTTADAFRFALRRFAEALNNATPTATLRAAKRRHKPKR